MAEPTPTTPPPEGPHAWRAAPADALPPDIDEAIEFLRPVYSLLEALSTAAIAIRPEGLIPVADAFRRALAGIDGVLARDAGGHA